MAEPNVVAVKFIDDVEAFVAGREIDSVIAQLQDQYQRYKMLESRLHQRRVKLTTKLPDIKKALEMVDLLIAKRGSGDEVNVDFELTEGVFSRAVLRDTATVSLWLGANVMLEYSLDEAHEILSRNFNNCQSQLDTIKKELAHIRDSVTIVEVSIARVYNYDISRRRALKQKAGGDAEAGEAAA